MSISDAPIPDISSSPAPLAYTGPTCAEDALSRAELSAARSVVVRVLDEVPAQLVQAALFGSKARGQARADSDVDILLVFRELPPDREPHAGHAEAIADEVAEFTGVPVTVWSVSLVDLELGQRTPMLVDALEDSLPLWCWPEPIPPIDFTPADAVRCGNALLQRVAEGSVEFADSRHHGDLAAALRRGRDDVIRLCTALLLFRGVTRPRRGAIIDHCVQLGLWDDGRSPVLSSVLEWTRQSFGPEGRNDELPIPPPPVSERQFISAVDELRRRVAGELARMSEGPTDAGTPDPLGG